MTIRMAYRAYMRGGRSRRYHGMRYCYWYNPYPIQSSEWYSFNIGWNDYAADRHLYLSG
jgi:hypothetical protein